MSPVLKGEARHHQLVTTYGVGSVIALGDESFMVAGIDYWKVTDPTIHEPRLERQLRVDGFVEPPASGDDHRADIPVVRFPLMHSCPSCGRLAPHHEFTTFDRNRCELCEALLIPSRFVVACANGHIDDFPYFRWVHAGSPAGDVRHDLRLSIAGTTASLRDVVVACSCGREMSMDGSFRATALRGIAKCTGRSPWIKAAADTPCTEVPRTLQRGASNVWFPILQSALSIPPWSEGLFQVLEKHWNIFRVLPAETLPAALEGIAEKTGYNVEDLVAAALQRRSSLEQEDGDGDASSLRSEEYEALVRGRAEKQSNQDFICQKVALDGSALPGWFEAVMSVPRLREVRALEAFTRVLPPAPADPPERRAPLCEASPGWLPAMSVSGEGIFLKANLSRLGRWERRPDVAARIRTIDERYRARFEARGLQPDRRITPRFVMLHTLAHLLINQWALECGYPAASLRERIYASDSMAGILIFTASSDSAGSLGGVVALANPKRLEVAVREAVDRASWCSSDPLCSESLGSGVDALNLAACHACLLLPEVSCEELNILLDRACVVDTPGTPGLGFLDARLD